MRTPPLPADFIYTRICKLICAKFLTLPVSVCNAEDLIDNTNTQLEFNVPVDTTAGTYRLIVKTASSTGNRINKTLRTGIMEDVVTVKTA